MPDEAPENLQIRTQWIVNPGQLPSLVNQFAILGGPSIGESSRPNSWVIIFGHLTPPLPPQPGDAAAMAAFVEQTVVPVVPVGQFEFTEERLRELHEKLGATIKALDERHG